MNIKITVEFAHDLDMEAREVVTIVHNIGSYSDASVEDIREALDKFRSVLDSSPRIPVA